MTLMNFGAKNPNNPIKEFRMLKKKNTTFVT